jgi:uncharacterized protein YcbX
MTAVVTGIFRHPIKGIGREELAEVTLVPGQGLPFDRHWAVAHEAARLSPGWNACGNFLRGAKAPALMAVEAALVGDTVTLRHPERPDLTLRPDDAADLPRLLDWLQPLLPPGRAAPVAVAQAGVAMTDSDYPSVSVISLASCRALGEKMGLPPLDPRRFRGNLVIDGLEPFAEFEWVGQRLQVGEAELEVVERIERCRATMANPGTGVIDADTLAALNNHYGHQDFGIFGRVVRGGTVRTGDRVAA